jgi:hypothetical protein
MRILNKEIRTSNKKKVSKVYDKRSHFQGRLYVMFSCGTLAAAPLLPRGSRGKRQME